MTQKYLSPNLTMQPEWDLIELSKELYDALPQDPDTAWVKRHQDDAKERQTLPLAKL
jgi:hypothetical protein